jgi:hypothetical protein
MEKDEDQERDCRANGRPNIHCVLIPILNCVRSFILAIPVVLEACRLAAAAGAARYRSAPDP